ncbi:hypothetical protein TRFO_39048 [Tritrichomonas foetus]|uniref:SMP-LTD domain-containing protein n=1 Tax=Tritrichomonas foetus TaxID=1144522 RepID=A0A1J4JC06_9EUKA|nr:hypothetical protein TRFO_39048 [Tritrichomonas foetus]|eukprot:OHS94788.1 hypothetical protein TRFO_39048 [Tritrichomonas foetus]
MFIFSLLIFFVGFILGIIVLFAILFILSLQEIRKSPRPKPKSKKENRPINFGDATQLQWMNRLLWRTYPILLNRHKIKTQIKSIFAQIPKDIPQIRKLNLSQFCTGLTPPFLDNASLHLEDESDYLKFCFHFEPDLEIGAEVEYGVKIIGSIPVAAEFKLHSLNGHFILKIPPEKGKLEIGIKENTFINFDITAQLGVVLFKSEEWKSVWANLKNWIHHFLHTIVIKIPLEENLEKAANPINKTSSAQEIKLKQPEKPVVRKTISPSKSSPSISHRNSPSQASKPKASPTQNRSPKTSPSRRAENEGCSQGFKIRHYMAKWDYEF